MSFLCLWGTTVSNGKDLKCAQDPWLKVQIMKQRPNVLSKFVKLLLRAMWLFMTIKHVDSLLPFLGTERFDSANKVQRLVLHSQISTFPEKF